MGGGVTPDPTSAESTESMETAAPEAEEVQEEQTDAAESLMKISIRINDGNYKLVPDVKKSVSFGGVVKLEGMPEDEDADIKLYIGVSEKDKENAKLLNAVFEETGDGEQKFEVVNFSLEPFEKDARLPESLALFVGRGEIREFVMDLAVDNNHRVVICGLICGGCIIAMTVCIILLIRTNKKLRKEKYRLLDLKTRKSQRTVRNEK